MAARRPLTDKQREIRSAQRAYQRMESAHTQELASRASTRSQVRLQSEAAIARQQGQRRRNERLKAVPGNVAGTAAGAVISPVTQGPAKTNIFLVIIFTMAGLIVFYDLVAHPKPTSSFLGGVGNWLHTLSSTQALFTSVSTTGATTASPTSAKGRASTTTGQVILL